MYSVVLLMAMSNGVEVPDCHRRGGGCYGGCYGGWSYGGCWGGGYGGCWGGNNYCGCQGGTAVYGGGHYKTKKKVQADDEEQMSDEEQNATSRRDPARISIALPVDARLVVNGVTSTSTKAMRTFASPALPVGTSYSFNVAAEMQRDGKTIHINKVVNVDAGKRSRIELSLDKTQLTQR